MEPGNIDTHIRATIKKKHVEHKVMEVWFRWFSFSIGWFLGNSSTPKKTEAFLREWDPKGPKVTKNFSTSQDVCSCFSSFSQTLKGSKWHVSHPFLLGVWKPCEAKMICLKRLVRAVITWYQPKQGTTVDGWNLARKPPGCIKTWKQWDFNYQPQLASWISEPSTVLRGSLSILHIDVHQVWFLPKMHHIFMIPGQPIGF